MASIPCFLCGTDLEIRTDKHNKPYFICDHCGVQAFVRKETGIVQLEKLLRNLRTQDFQFAKHKESFLQICLMQTPGTLTGENILADVDGRTWLTDFARAGLAPTQWNFVALEATIRFDWVDVKNPRWLHQMEQLLVSNEFLRLPVSDLEAPLRKPIRAIEAVRRIASRQTDRDWLQYHLGIFFQAVRRMADFNPKHNLASDDLVRMAHVLIAAALIAKYVGESRLGLSSDSRPEVLKLRVDTVNQEVWLAERCVMLSQQSYALLCELNEHAYKLCTRRELVERALGERYDETDESQIGRLNTAVRRLREKIEDNPDEPRYILTEPGRGYRLVPGPRESGRSQLAS